GLATVRGGLEQLGGFHDHPLGHDVRVDLVLAAGDRVADLVDLVRADLRARPDLAARERAGGFGEVDTIAGLGRRHGPRRGYPRPTGAGGDDTLRFDGVYRVSDLHCNPLSEEMRVLGELSACIARTLVDRPINGVRVLIISRPPSCR